MRATATARPDASAHRGQIAALIAECAALRSDVEALRSRVSALERQQASPVVIFDPQVVHGIAAVVQDRAFSAREILDHAQLVDPSLRRTLAAAGITTPQRLGKLLQYLERQDLDGLQLERLGRDNAGIVWRFHAP